MGTGRKSKDGDKSNKVVSKKRQIASLVCTWGGIVLPFLGSLVPVLLSPSDKPMPKQLVTVMISSWALGFVFICIGYLIGRQRVSPAVARKNRNVKKLLCILTCILVILVAVALWQGITYMRLHLLRNKLQDAVERCNANTILVQYYQTPERLSRVFATSNPEFASATVQLLVKTLYNAPRDTFTQLLYALLDFYPRISTTTFAREHGYTLPLAEELYKIAIDRNYWNAPILGELINEICWDELFYPWGRRVYTISNSTTSCSKSGDYRPAMPIENIPIVEKTSYFVREPLKIDERIKSGELGPSAVQKILDSIRYLILSNDTTVQVGVYVPISSSPSSVSSEPALVWVTHLQLIDLDHQCITAEKKIYGPMPPAQITRTYPKPRNVIDITMPQGSIFPSTPIEDKIREWIASLPER